MPTNISCSPNYISKRSELKLTEVNISKRSELKLTGVNLSELKLAQVVRRTTEVNRSKHKQAKLFS
jgi:hypothetical protein